MHTEIYVVFMLLFINVPSFYPKLEYADIFPP